MLPKANEERIRIGLETLATFDSAPDQPGTTRMLFTEEELAAIQTDATNEYSTYVENAESNGSSHDDAVAILKTSGISEEISTMESPCFVRSSISL